MMIIKFIVSLINLVRFLPHCILLFFYKRQCSDDIQVAMEHRGIENKVYRSLFLGFLFLMTWDKTYRNIFYYRIKHWKYLIKWIAPPHDSFVIGTYAEIGPAMLGVHPFGSYINARKIGRNFVIKNNVTIGNKGFNEKPIIGDNVEVNVNSVVFGKIQIGDNVIIGAGTVLNKSVPSNSIVVGNPAYIIKQNGIRVNRKL